MPRQWPDQTAYRSSPSLNRIGETLRFRKEVPAAVAS
jgi:hypothetical protein